MIINVGFTEAMKDFQWDCFIFHDVDLLPEDDRNLYNCPEKPRHMSVAVDKFNYKLPYKEIFGGVVAISTNLFRELNGFSNLFWGVCTLYFGLQLILMSTLERRWCWEKSRERWRRSRKFAGLTMLRCVPVSMDRGIC